LASIYTLPIFGFLFLSMFNKFACAIVLLLLSLSSWAQHTIVISSKTPAPFDTTFAINPNTKLLGDSIFHWENWVIRKNYDFEKNRGELPMIADLKALHPYFRDKMFLLIEKCKAKGIHIEVVESFRTNTKQAEYFGMGRKYTRSAGGNSKHQYGLACDVVPIINGKPVWENKALWRKIGVEGEKLGLRWGGRWRHPYDPAHFEWTNGITTQELKAGIFPKPNNTIYPCLDEDIAMLKKVWQVWEKKQKEAWQQLQETETLVSASSETP
jgi:peptidoglycan L-alanyl-D-glutamate endopeptidase CwlK